MEGVMALYVITNLRLPKEMLKRLKLKAIEQDKSVSQLLREAIENYILSQTTSKKGDYQTDSFNHIIGIARSGIKDGSVAHDRYLYGEK